MNEVAIVSAVRTPVGNFGSSLRTEEIKMMEDDRRRLKSFYGKSLTLMGTSLNEK